MELSNLPIGQILQILRAGKSLGKKELETLANQELMDPKRTNVFNITWANVGEIIMELSLIHI